MRHEIINDINLTVRTLLETELKSVFKNVAVKLADLENFKKGETKTGVNIFLYNVQVNEIGIKTNQEPDQVEEGPEGETLYLYYPPPIPLTLSFMITPFASDPQTEYRLLGRILQVVQECPILSGEQLKGDWLPKLEKISLTPDIHLTFERQLEIFRAFDAHIKMSVGYIARTYLESDKVVKRSKIARSVRPDLGRSNPQPADSRQPTTPTGAAPFRGR